MWRRRNRPFIDLINKYFLFILWFIYQPKKKSIKGLKRNIVWKCCSLHYQEYRDCLHEYLSCFNTYPPFFSQSLHLFFKCSLYRIITHYVCHALLLLFITSIIYFCIAIIKTTFIYYIFLYVLFLTLWLFLYMYNFTNFVIFQFCKS